jgi:signal transduction histidine kinase
MQESFSRRLIESQENERKRMAAELHDSLGQSLLVVKNYAAMALKEPKLLEKTQKQLQEISDGASASIEEVRSIARALRPYQLDRFGLTKTLEDAAELAAQPGHREIARTIENIDGLFSADAEINIYRIVQEWLNNVVKHSRASRAGLLVRKDAGIVRMILEDDGVGFVYDAAMKRAAGGFGLANLGERIRLLGGSLNIESAPGKGTRLLVNLPCKK